MTSGLACPSALLLLLPLLLLLRPAFAVLHTSASLTINENASPDVPLDLNVSLTVMSAVQLVLQIGQDAQDALPCIADLAVSVIVRTSRL
jgi:hypothetical protein